ncbi:PhoH family protein, partial [Burkholderia multivorans]
MTYERRTILDTSTDSSTAADSASSETVRLVIPDSIDLVEFFGPGEANLRTLERVFSGLDLHLRGNQLQAAGDPDQVSSFVTVIGELKKLHQSGHRIDEETIDRVASFSSEG